MKLAVTAAFLLCLFSVFTHAQTVLLPGGGQGSGGYRLVSRTTEKFVNGQLVERVHEEYGRSTDSSPRYERDPRVIATGFNQRPQVEQGHSHDHNDEEEVRKKPSKAKRILRGVAGAALIVGTEVVADKFGIPLQYSIPLSIATHYLGEKVMGGH